MSADRLRYRRGKSTNIVKVLEVSRVKAPIQLVGDNTLHHNVDAEGIEALADELLSHISLTV